MTDLNNETIQKYIFLIKMYAKYQSKNLNKSFLFNRVISNDLFFRDYCSNKIIKSTKHILILNESTQLGNLINKFLS